MERRSFIKTSCSVCVAIGAGLTLASVSSCSPTVIYRTTVTENKINVPLSLFAESDLQIIRPSGFENDIALRKEQNGSYTALLLRCTHADNQVSTTGNGFVCNLHGSTFTKEGEVTKGPAQRPLKKYKTEINPDTIIINLT